MILGDALSPSEAGRTPGRAVLPATDELAVVPSNPMPPGLSARVLRTPDGLGLRMAMTAQLPRAPRGTVLLLPGRADFIEKYFEPIGELQARGFAVACLDWRGQGGSQRLLADPSRNHAAGFDGFAVDLATALAELRARNWPRPVVGLAHSMGAAALLLGLRRAPLGVDRAVLTAPMIALSPSLRPPFAEMAARLCNAVGLGRRSVPVRGGPGAPGFPPDNVLTSDARRYLRSLDVIAAAPRLAVGRPTIGWLNSAFAAMATLRQPSFARGLETKLLCVAGADDAVVSTEATARFAAQAPLARLSVLAGCRHDILMERDEVRAAFWREFDGFVSGD
ncbi:alpha/beta hydrolase [Alsobacter sp. SYSU M60028]|uniref:Alpha/beta hydrolase n=1 Tax=Alsobacter ponti TaxID=2962936 RepID=A0ABT1LCS2_9HYPH|nr:alpha/beta hydrolase [Alsobacter ponti]MCP8939299.1 alpha/beta hydrolase [Alsobacter ponti]